MKTTFLPVFALMLATMAAPQIIRASATPLLDEEGEALEMAPAATLASAELQPGPAKVAGRNVNVRAKATIQSEVVTQMQDGEDVVVEEVILRPDAKGKDPARWAKIAYPTRASTWVHSLYIDESSAVKPKKLNVRAGPGENYTVVGGLLRGDIIEQLGTKGDWLLIQPPKGSTAYVAAKLLRQEAPVVEEVATTETEVIETTVVDSQEEIATGEAGEPEMVMTEVETTEMAVLGGEPTVTDSGATNGTSDLEPLPEVAPVLEPVPEEPLPPRIVEREGIVRSFTSIQAPSGYKLVSVDNGRKINYLYTTSTNLDLSRYVGLHIMAQGEESLDTRWPDMPLLTLKRIVLVE